MKNFKQWIADKLFALLTWLSPTEQPTPGEMRAWALEEAQKPPQSQIWIDPTVRSYPQQEPKSAVYEPPEKQTDPYGAIHQQLAQRRSEMYAHNNAILHKKRLVPVIGTNTEPIDLAANPPDWLVGINDPTAKVPAIKKQAYQEYHKRHAG